MTPRLAAVTVGVLSAAIAPGAGVGAVIRDDARRLAESVGMVAPASADLEPGEVAAVAEPRRVEPARRAAAPPAGTMRREPVQAASAGSRRTERSVRRERRRRDAARAASVAAASAVARQRVPPAPPAVTAVAAAATAPPRPGGAGKAEREPPRPARAPAHPRPSRAPQGEREPSRPTRAPEPSASVAVAVGPWVVVLPAWDEGGGMDERDDDGDGPDDD
jgi:hypothetical protein